MLLLKIKNERETEIGGIETDIEVSIIAKDKVGF